MQVLPIMAPLILILVTIQFLDLVDLDLRLRVAYLDHQVCFQDLLKHLRFMHFQGLEVEILHFNDFIPD